MELGSWAAGQNDMWQVCSAALSSMFSCKLQGRALTALGGSPPRPCAGKRGALEEGGPRFCTALGSRQGTKAQGQHPFLPCQLEGGRPSQQLDNRCNKKLTQQASRPAAQFARQAWSSWSVPAPWLQPPQRAWSPPGRSAMQ